MNASFHLNLQGPEACSEPCQASKMTRFAKIANSFQP